MKLEAVFGHERLFMDVEGYINAGDDFVRVLDSQVAQCDVILVVIGPRWLSITDDQNRRRLENPEDFVRIEIVSGLARGKWVIPLLVNNARMPGPENLPGDLRPLARRNAVSLSHERFGSDCDRLIRELKKALQAADDRRVAAEQVLKEFNDALQGYKSGEHQSKSGPKPAERLRAIALKLLIQWILSSIPMTKNANKQVTSRAFFRSPCRSLVSRGWRPDSLRANSRTMIGRSRQSCRRRAKRRNRLASIAVRKLRTSRFRKKKSPI